MAVEDRSRIEGVTSILRICPREEEKKSGAAAKTGVR